MTRLKLIDLYGGNTFNPAQIKADGYVGVIFKAGQGAWADCPRYHPEWWEMAADEGLMRGWYWLSDSRIHSSNHVTEMENFHIFDDMGELGLWIDIEKPIISMKEVDYWKTRYAGHQNVVDLFYLLRLQGINPDAYTGPGAYGLVMRDAPQSVHDYLAQGSRLWTAQYPWVYIEGVSRPTLFGSWTNWTLWQYREGPDVNIFNGTDAEFYEQFGGVVIPPPPTGDPMPQYKVTTTKDVTNIRATGGLPLGDIIGNLKTTQTGYGTEVLGSPTGSFYCLKVDSGADLPGWVFARYNDKPTYATITEVVETPPPPAGLPVLHLTATADGYETKAFDLNPL